MVQAWVWTLQDTLGVRDDVLIRLHGKPFDLLRLDLHDEASDQRRVDSAGPTGRLRQSTQR